MLNLYIIAGPKGAGQTTAAYSILPEILDVKEFVNADEIARGISPFNVESVAIQAGKIMLQRIEQLIDLKQSFCIETTLTTKSYLKTIENAKQQGYHITLVYIWLSTVELAIERVNDRVAKGGHNIPKEIIERRYIKGMQNLPKFMEAAFDWYLLDNSKSFYKIVAKCVDNGKSIFDNETYLKLLTV